MMENSGSNKAAQHTIWLKLSMILTAVVLGLLSAQTVLAAIIAGTATSWFNISGTQAQFWIGSYTSARLMLGFTSQSMRGATLGYLIMVYVLPVVVAAVIVLLSLRFMRGKKWLSIVQALAVGLLAYWLVQAILKLLF